MPGCDYVTMRAGLVVPIEVIRRLWALGQRGVRLRLDDGDVLAGPRRLLEDADLAFITEHKAMVISILAMQVTA